MEKIRALWKSVSIVPETMKESNFREVTIGLFLCVFVFLVGLFSLVLMPNDAVGDCVGDCQENSAETCIIGPHAIPDHEVEWYKCTPE